MAAKRSLTRHATSVSLDQVRWLRFRRSGLSDRLGSPAEVARRLAGVHAQINTAAFFAIAQRAARGMSFESAERAVQRDRALVRLTGQRGTLHLFAPEDVAMACAAVGAMEKQRVEARTRKGITSDATDPKSVRRDGAADIVALERACATCLRALLEHAGRAQDVPRVSRDDFEKLGCDPRLSYGVFAILTSTGQAFRVERGDNATPEIAARKAWLPSLGGPGLSCADAMKQLAIRYFSGYGPATEADFRYFIAGRAGDSAPPVSALLAEGALQPVDVAGSPMLLPPELVEELESPVPPVERWPVKLLYRFDPLMVAHRDKTIWLYDAGHHPKVWHSTHVEPVLLVQGKIRALWKHVTKTSKLGLNLSVLGPRLTPRERDSVAEQAASVAAFYGLELGAIDEKSA